MLIGVLTALLGVSLVGFVGLVLMFAFYKHQITVYTRLYPDDRVNMRNYYNRECGCVAILMFAVALDILFLSLALSALT